MEARHGRLYVIGLGPGDTSLLTQQARAALAASDVVVGYRTYLDLIPGLIAGKEVVASGMTQEVARAKLAVEAAASGKVVAVVSGGDPGVYGMAGPVYEVLRERGWARGEKLEVEVVPGVPALAGAAALLGAPLMHDFAAVSLSDLLTPWETIVKRLDLAAQADFILALYNPRSRRRTDQLAEAQRIISRHRAPTTPVGIVRAAYRPEQRVTVTDLEHLPQMEQDVDMLSLVVVGNSTTVAFDQAMVTPRGYATKYDLASAPEGGGSRRRG